MFEAEKKNNNVFKIIFALIILVCIGGFTK